MPTQSSPQARGLLAPPEGRPSTAAWQGRSGRRHRVSVHALSVVRLDEVGEVVVIAVRCTEAGRLSVIKAEDTDAVADPVRWIEDAEARGATEIHICRAHGPAERRAVILDLPVEVA